jgi:uncharacterized YkwD family protein
MKFIRKLTAFVIMLMVLFSLSTTSTTASTITPQFKDIPSNHWAKNEIDELVSKEIISGYSDGTFKPNHNMTRAEVAVMIGKALHISTKDYPNPNFSDVSTTNPAFPYIAALVGEGVFAKAKKFNPDASLTRAQMAKILVEAFDITGSTSKVFNDVPKTNWAYPHVTKLVANSITTGKTHTLFDANGKVTRVQMTVFVKRAMDYKNKVSLPSVEDLTIAREVLAEVNEERSKANVAPLKLNIDVTKVAQAKAQDMYDNDYFDHKSPTYGRIFDMLKYFGVNVENASENIAEGQDSSQEVVADWMTSPGHKRNILSSYATEMGVGMVKGDKGTYWVQVFIHK